MAQVEIVVPFDAPANADTVINHLRAAGLALNYQRTVSPQADVLKIEADSAEQVAQSLGLAGTGLTIRAVAD